MSLAAKLLNVFAVPGEVFNDVRRTPSMLSNWLVPSLLGALVGAVSVVLLLSQPNIQQQFQDRQRKLIEQADKARKLTPQEQQVVEKMTGPTMVKLFGAGGAVVSSFISLLWWGFGLWFIARRMLRVPVAFGKALEVAGLSMMIDVLYGLVAVLLIVKLDKVGATSSLALIIKDLDAARKGHLFAVAANIFAFWLLGVRSIGLAKLADVPYLRAAWLVVSFWFLQQLLLVLSGVAQLAM
jgi:hypothetical protein